MDARERELLTGMGNCYAACGGDFEHTVEMVADSRDRTVGEVTETLARMKATYHGDADYRTLRARLPDSFPL